MFLALRDIRFAKGRFALLVCVVTMVSFLLVVLTALTGGLGHQSTSAVTSLRADRVLLAPSGRTTTWSDSLVDAQTLADSRHQATLQVHPLTIAHARVTLDDSVTSVALFGADADAASALGLPRAPGDGEVILPRDTATSLHLTTQDRTSLDRTGAAPTVSLDGMPVHVQSVEATRWYSHSPVAYVSRGTLARLAHSHDTTATALLVNGSASAIEAFAASHHLTAMTPAASVSALPGYRSEHGSLLMIQGFLYGIGTTVVMAFLSVWALQRTRDIAVLRALGASRRRVLGDSLRQAALLLVLGAGSGVALGALAAWGVRHVVPVEVLWTSTLLPGIGVCALGVLGALLATRRVTHVDPVLALGGN